MISGKIGRCHTLWKNGTIILYLSGIPTRRSFDVAGNDYSLTTLTGSSSSYTTRYYVYSPAGLIAVVDNGTTYFIAKDHLGSTCGVLNSSNNSKNSWYAYTPYGNVWTGSVNEDPSYKFTGQECEQEFGLYNFRAREYDPTLGIFCAADAAGQDFSPYMYCGGNPTMFSDPTGRLFGIDDLIEWGLLMYSAYSAGRQAYSTYQAIKSGDAGNIVGALMSDAFTAASLGVGGSGPGGFYTSDWAEHIGFAGLENMAGYYAGGGKGLIGGLESFGEGAVPAALSMLVEYDEVNAWVPPLFADEGLAAMPSYDLSSPTLTMGTVSAQLPQPYWEYDQSTGKWSLMYSTKSESFKGYAGNGLGLNNPDMEDVQNVGPIPRGWYRIGPIGPHDDGRLQESMRLIPLDQATSETLASYHRSEFLFHGARSNYAYEHFLDSEGCPISRPWNRELVANSGVFILEVMR